MNLHAVASFSDAPETAAIICLLSTASGSDTFATVSSGAWDETWTKAGQKTLISHDGRTIICLGMGEAPTLEHYRKAAHTVFSTAAGWRMNEIAVVTEALSDDQAQAFVEGAILSAYRFTRHLSKPAPEVLTDLYLVGFSEAAIQTGSVTAAAACEARDLVNEPANILTATKLATEAKRLGEKYGFTTEILEMSKIQSLKMGGLLAVNAGSVEPPTFTIMEYKPETPINDQPVVLVGKGVVYDTGGLSLKPTANSMDFMKCDMAGGAAVIGAMCGVAGLGLDVHVIGLVPATDNRPGLNAWAPGDIVTMYDGTTVENFNSDAEGRMLLADALSYAKQYNPSLVIDLATLTGAQVVAIGQPGMALMATAEDETVANMDAAGHHTYERVVRLPLWEEYGDMLKSEIADIKNLGPRQAGSITAGKFLQHFTDYPWIHLDIAGPAWSPQPDSYRGQGGTGVGVRMLIQFLKAM